MTKYMSLLVIILTLMIFNVSYAEIYIEKEPAITGQKFNLNIKSNIDLGAYVVEVQNYGNLKFVKSSGQEGSGKTIITGVSTAGERNLANFTFEIPRDINIQTDIIKIRAYSMETPNLESVANQEITEIIEIKKDFATPQTNGFEYNNKNYIVFSLNGEDDVLTASDIEMYYPSNNIEVNKNCLVNGDTIKIDDNEYCIIIHGDVNCDGKISIFDAVSVLNYVKNRGQLTENQQFATKTKIDDQINIMSAVKILNMVKGKI